MTLPAGVVVSTDKIPQVGIGLALFPRDTEFSLEVQRAPDDGGGDPDAGSAVLIATLPPSSTVFVDYRESQDDTWHYRWRHIRDGYTAGPWTGWIAGRARQIPHTIPELPTNPLLDASALFDADDYELILELNGESFVRSALWEVDTSGSWPDLDDGGTTCTALDAAGDASVSTGTTLDPGQTARVEIRFFDAPSCGGNLVGSIRLAITRQAGSPTVEEVAATWEDDTSDLVVPVNWTPGGGANSTEHDLTIQFWVNDAMVLQETGVSLDQSQPYVKTLTGEGGLTPPNEGWVKIILELKSNDSTLDTKESRRVTITVFVNPPTSPTAAATADHTIRVGWSLAGDVDYYRVYGSQTPGIQTSILWTGSSDTDEFWDHTSLDPNETWYYQVSGFEDTPNPDVESAKTATVSATTWPAVPLSFNGTWDGAAIDYTWDNGARSELKTLEVYNWNTTNWDVVSATIGTGVEAYDDFTPSANQMSVGGRVDTRIKFNSESTYATDTTFVPV